METELCCELEQLRANKVLYVAEIEDLKRRVCRAETERREFGAQRARLERERSALKKHIEAVSLEDFVKLYSFVGCTSEK